MKKFIRELRRREVFRTGGLYVGIAWILIEASSVILPTFDVPDWVFKAVVITAFVGFPVALVLAWFYDVTEEGVLREDEKEGPPGTLVGGRQTDFIVIGVLAVALIVSVYLNMIGGPAVEEELAPVSVLIADFDNQTGDALFDGSLEQALNIGLEGATFITAYNRLSATRLLDSIKPGNKLDEAGARLVSIREGVKLVIAGSIKADGGGYAMSARIVNPEDGELVAEESVGAKNKIEVLAAVSGLADSIRKELGDKSVGSADRPLGETFTAASLEAVKNYTQGQDLAAAARYDEALPFYETAVSEDPNFGRAYSGWALTLFYLGRVDEAKALWEKALTKMDTMTERERYRTLGLYYVAVAGDFPKAVESYSALVAKYPADNTAYNNMAISYYFMLDFKQAMDAAGKGLAIYPSNKTVMSNYALFAMLAGEFETANARAEQLLAEDPLMWKAWLPVAMSKLAVNDLDGARQAYNSMAAAGDRGAAFANLGLADLEIYSENYAQAAAMLETGIGIDLEDGNKRLSSTKYIVLAEASKQLDNKAATRDALKKGLAQYDGLGQSVAAALISLDIGDKQSAAAIADKLSKELQPKSRSFGLVISGAIATQEDRHAEAMDLLRTAIPLTDSWLLRFYLGRAYFQAGRYIEALDEFETCLERRGEATAMFLDDDEPTWRYMAPLDAWLIKARAKLGMADSPAPEVS